MRDLAFLSMARTYYSASISLDRDQLADDRQHQADRRGQVLEQGRRRPASTGSTRSSRSRGRTSWPATTRTRSATSTRSQSPYFPNSFYPEADVLKAVIYFSNCQYDDATTVVAQFNKKYTPIKEELEKVLKHFKGENKEEPFFKFLLEVRAGKAATSAERIRPIVENALSDRQLLRNIEYVKLLDDEDKRFKKAPPSFQSSPLGNDVRDALKLARDLAVRQRRGARARALPAQRRRAERAPARRCEDPHRHHRRAAQPARREDRDRPGQRGRVEDFRRSSSPTKST